MLAPAFAVACTAQAPVLTGALLGAVEAIGSVSAGDGAVVALPPWHAEAGAGDRVALATVLTLAFLGAAVTPPVDGTRFTAAETHIARPTVALSCDMVTWAICMHAVSTHFRTILAKVSGRAWLIAVLAHPSPFANADSCFWVTRGIVLAVAGVFTRGTPLTSLTLTITGHTFKPRCTDAASRDMVTSKRVFPVALAFFLALSSKSSVIALRFAEFTHKTGRAGAIATDRITTGPISTLALDLATRPIETNRAKFIATGLRKARRTAAVPIHVGADSSIFAAAVLGAIRAKPSNRALLLAVGTNVSRLTDTHSIDWIASSVVFAAARQSAVRAVKQRWTGPDTGLSVPAGLALARAGPGVTQKRVFFATLADLVTLWTIIVVCAGSCLTSRSCKARKADALSIRNVAACTVVTVTFLAAVQAVSSDWTLILATLSDIAWAADARASQVVTEGAIVASAALTAVGSVEASGARICTNSTGPSLRAEAVAINGIAGSTVLATTLARALVTVCAFWTELVAQWPAVARGTSATSRDVVTKSSIETAACLSAFVAILPRIARFITVNTLPTWLA
uniref:Uncharacterized protein n=1 Tax=Ixodes ricinus TaxID=34613 RepID=A0A147BEL0_IXORI